MFSPRWMLLRSCFIKTHPANAIENIQVNNINDNIDEYVKNSETIVPCVFYEDLLFWTEYADDLGL